MESLAMDHFFSISSELFFISDREGRLEWNGPGFTRVLGWSSEELAGKRYLDLVYGPDQRIASEALEKIMTSNGGNQARVEVRFQSSDGSLHWIDLSGKCVGDRMYGVGRDVSSYHRTMQEMDRIEKRNQAFLHSIPDLMFRFSSDGIFLDFIAPPDTVLAMPPDSFLQRSVTDVFPEDIAARTMESILAALANGELQEFEYRFEDADYEARLVRSGENEVLALVRDVTSERRAQEQMRVYADLVKNMKAGVLIWRQEDMIDYKIFRLVASNPIAHHSMGTTPEINGRLMRDVFEHWGAGMAALFDEVIREGSAQSMDHLELGHGRVTTGSIVPISDTYIGVLFDPNLTLVEDDWDHYTVRFFL